MSMYPEVVGPGHMVILFLVVLTFVLIFTVTASFSSMEGISYPTLL